MAIPKKRQIKFRVMLVEPSGSQRFRELSAQTLIGARRQGRAWASSVSLGGKVVLEERQDAAWAPVGWLSVDGSLVAQSWKRPEDAPLQPGDTRESAAARELRLGLELIAQPLEKADADAAPGLRQVRGCMESALAHLLAAGQTGA